MIIRFDDLDKSCGNDYSFTLDLAFVGCSTEERNKIGAMLSPALYKKATGCSYPYREWVEDVLKCNGIKYTEVIERIDMYIDW